MQNFHILEKEKYEIWAMKMEYWIQNADHNLWRIVQQGNSPKRLGKDAKGNTIVHPPVSLDEHVVVQRENKKKRKNHSSSSQITEFSVTKEEGQQRYTGFRDLRDQFIQVLAKPDNDAINLKFSKSTSSSWSQDALSLKNKRWPDSNSFDDLYNKLMLLLKAYYSDHRVDMFHHFIKTSVISDNKMEYVLAFFLPMSTVDDKARYSAFNDTEVKTDEPKALDSFDFHVKLVQIMRQKQDCEVEKVYGMMAGLHTNNRRCWCFSEAAADLLRWGFLPKTVNDCLVNSSMSTRTKIGLGFKEYFGEDEVFDLSRPSTMYPQNLLRRRLNLFTHGLSRLGEMHAFSSLPISGTYMPIPTKSDIEETQPVTSLQTQRPINPVIQASRPRPKTVPPAVDITKLLPDVLMLRPKFHSWQSYFSCLENHPVPLVSQNSSASVYLLVDLIQLLVEIRPATTPVLLVDPVSAGWLNPAARPYFRPSSVYFNNMYWPDVSDPMYMNKGRRGTAVKTSVGNHESEIFKEKPLDFGIGHEWYFDLDYLTDSLGYTRFKTDKPAGTQETNINAGTQDHDSDSEVDEQVIVVPSFPSNSFAGPSSSNGPSVMERNADYAEELAKLQRQEYEAKDAAARYGYLFSQETAEILSQAEAEIRNQGVSADRDPAGIDSAGGVSAGSASAGSDPAGGNPAGSFQPAGSYEPAGQGNPAVSTSVSADFIPVHADESTLPPGQSLGSSENTTRFPVPSDVCKDNLSSGIFTSSSYDDDFSATLTNLAPAVEVNPVPTKRVNTIHPQSQILGDLASPVLTRSRAQKSNLEPTSKANHLRIPDWLRYARKDANSSQPEVLTTCPFTLMAKNAIWTQTRGGIDYDGIAPVPEYRQTDCFAFASICDFGFEDPNVPKHVYRWLKALYGLHSSNLEPGMDINFVQVYVDDIIFGSTNKAWCDDFEVLMKGEFEMSAMGEMNFFLGLQVKQLPDGIFISQDKYVKDMLTKFDMESVRTATTPYEAAKTKLKDETDPPVNVHLYRSMIGSLMYLTASRPDINICQSVLCSRPSVTPLTFSSECSQEDFKDRKSLTGGCKILGRRLIFMAEQEQTNCGYFSTEAGVVACAELLGTVVYAVNTSIYAAELFDIAGWLVSATSHLVSAGSLQSQLVLIHGSAE
ncbi:putative ribonuclease H-like domain-containing protein [Tanacetum coccineum]